jgi:hypothetical protein
VNFDDQEALMELVLRLIDEGKLSQHQRDVFYGVYRRYTEGAA